MTTAVEVSRRIAAPAETLFDAWLDPASLAVWMRPSGIHRSTADVDARPGGTYRIVMYDARQEIVHSGRYREIDRPRLLSFSWRSPGTHHQDSLVTVRFTADGDSTLVEVRHERLPDLDEARRSHTAGWTDTLAELAALTETPPSGSVR